MSERTFPAWSEIDVEALQANYRAVRRLVGPDVRVIASVKADAYGLGAVGTARAFQDLGAFALATGSAGEALAIRDGGVTLPILLFSTYGAGDVPALLDHGFILTVHDLAVAEAVSRRARRPTPVYVKVDAGLGRLGVPIGTARAFIERVAAMDNVVVDGVYTHVAFGDGKGRDWATARLAEFDRLLADLSDVGLYIPVTQARASSCLLAGLGDSCNAVCVGHALYGLSPFSEPAVGDLSTLRPAFKALKSRLIHVAHHEQGADIAIGGLFGLTSGRTAGVAPVGLASGLLRPVPGGAAYALVRGRRVPVIAVSLEHTTLDLDGVEDASVGDEVTLIGVDGGEEITLDDMAAWQGRSPLEVLCMLAGRSERRFVRKK